jgi:hypothetical protein
LDGDGQGRDATVGEAVAIIEARHDGGLGHAPRTLGEAIDYLKPLAEEGAETNGTTLVAFNCAQGYPGYRPDGVPDDHVVACTALFADGTQSVKNISFDDQGVIIDSEDYPNAG